MAQSKSELPADFLQLTGRGECLVKCPEAVTKGNTLNEILVCARHFDISDVHLVSGAPVVFRRYGEMKAVSTDVLSGLEIEAMLKADIPPAQWALAAETGDLEYVHVIPGAGRFRVTVIRQRFGWDMTARLVDMKIRTVEESGMPSACVGLTKWAQGLVLVTGPAGCGKSSALSTLVEIVNQTRDDHIITIENPIEIVYESKHCQISQREVGLHTLSSANALRAALREDPDIIIISELRDLETIQLAITAGETGHLVFATMNTNDASQTVTSLVNYFPADEQPIIRNMISESLRGVICQQLIPRADGKGLIPAFEVMITNGAVSAMIKSGKSKQLNNVIATGRADGMVLLDTSLQTLVTKGMITGPEAWRRAINNSLFAQFAPPASPASPAPPAASQVKVFVAGEKVAPDSSVAPGQTGGTNG